MDKLQKTLAKISDKEAIFVEEILLRVKSRNYLGLNLIKLKGSKDSFRVKAGRLRAIFSMNSDGIKLIDVGYRSEKTYRNF